MRSAFQTPFAAVVVSLIRAASVAAFAGEALAVAATLGKPGWAAWRRFDLGWRFWMGLGSLSAGLAFACLIATPLLLLLGAAQAQRLRRLGPYVWLNVATIALLFFVPAVAAL